MTSMQLLFNQAPISAFMLLYVIPFVDTFPVWGDVSLNRWVLILLVSAQSLPGEGVLLTSHPSLASLPS
jgi:hypothetical protein